MDALAQIVLPVFALVALGYGAAAGGALDPAAARGLAAFVFRFALPAALFSTMAGAGLPAGAPLAFLAAYYLGTALMFAPALLFAPGGLDRRAILGFACAYGNTLILGVPLAAAAFGPEGSAALLLLIAFHSAIFFTLVTALAEAGRGGGTARRRAGAVAFARGLAAALFGNAILVSILAGLAFNLAGLALPGPAASGLALLGQAALPGALFSLGVSLRATPGVAAAGRAAAGIAALKLVAHPLLMALLVWRVFAVPEPWASVAILAASLPVGVNAHLFAQRYRVAEAEVATAILLSTAAAVGTVGALLAALRPAGAG